MSSDVSEPVLPNREAFDPIPTRYTLLERLKNWDDRTAWQDFFDIYWRLIYRVALKAGLGHSEAEEVVQQTVIAVARKIQEFKTDPNRGSFSAWLLQQTRWRIADQFRKRPGVDRVLLARDVLPQFPDETGSSDPLNRLPNPGGDALEAAWSQEWQENLMAAALERVKQQVGPRQYQIFDLHVLQKVSAGDTARTLRVSRAAVYMAKGRTSRALKAAVEKLRIEMA